MELIINANRIIDSLSPCIDTIQEAYNKIPRNSYIGEGSPYHNDYEKLHAAEQNINLANNITGIPIPALYATVRTARRWYNKTNWQYCLSDKTAQRLLEAMIESA